MPITYSIWDAFKNHKNIVVICICWYFIASVASQVTKQILTVCPLPLLLGQFQFTYTLIAAIIACNIAARSPRLYSAFPEGTFPPYFKKEKDKSSFKKCDAAPIITRPSVHILQTVIPLGFFQFVGKYFSHSSTALVPVSTVASIKTLAPVFIIIVQRILKINNIKLTKRVISSLFCLIIGVWIIVWEDSIPIKNYKSDVITTNTKNIKDFILGISFGILSMLIFVLQNVYGKKIFTFKNDSILPVTNRNASNEKISRSTTPFSDYSETPSSFKPNKNDIKYDKLTLMIYISIIGYSFSCFLFIIYDIPSTFNYIKNGFGDINYQIVPWRLLMINGFFHFIQALITFYLIGELSTLSYSVANLIKRIAVISGSWILIGKTITFFQIVGLFLNAYGLLCYERVTSEQRRELYRKNEKLQMSNPLF